jgi:hypothetical protein
VVFETTSTGVTVTGAATATTFLGDLNGTINTVTTAVTKANATNDTTVATTAFVQNLIGTIPAGLVFQGTWNAATNTPTLTSGTGTTGNFYIVSVAGTTSLDGITDWQVGDWAVFVEQGASDQWEKVDNSSVLDGSGTGQTVALWSGSGTSNTLTDTGSALLFSVPANTDGTNMWAQARILGTGDNASNGNAEGAMFLQTRALYNPGVGGSWNWRTNMVLRASGNVGIGTTSPATKLHIAGGTDASIIRLENTSTGLSQGDTIGAIQFYNNDTTDDSPNVAASIYATAGPSGGSGYLSFRTKEAGTEGSAATATMTLTNGGNVGIGTTNPNAKLQVELSGTVSLAAATIVKSTDFGASSRAGFPGLADNSDGIYFGMGANGTGIPAGFGFFREASGWNTALAFYTNNITAGPDSTAAMQEKMRITSGGNVGIGTSSPSQRLHVSGNVRVTGAYYDSSNSAGSSGQVLSSTGSGTAWVNQGEATATSLFDLLPAARVSYNWVGQVVNDTWTTVFSKSSNLLTTGTWMVKMYVSDFATGGGHYTYTYSGMFTWYQDTTNQGGEQAASEIYLHRMGHAANASVLYLRTTETTASSSGDGFFQIKGNYSNTANQTIQFQFVKIF